MQVNPEVYEGLKRLQEELDRCRSLSASYAADAARLDELGNELEAKLSEAKARLGLQADDALVFAEDGATVGKK